LLDAMIADRPTPGLQYAFVSARAVLFSVPTLEAV
jgi:hypothetical protein